VPSETIAQAIEGATGGFFQSLDGEVHREVLEAIVAAMDKTCILAIAAGSLVAVLSLFMKRVKLFGGGEIQAA
jgi:hypothetical protein